MIFYKLKKENYNFILILILFIVEILKVFSLLLQVPYPYQWYDLDVIGTLVKPKQSKRKD